MEDVPGLGIAIRSGPVATAAAPAPGAQPLGDGGAERVDLTGEDVTQASARAA